MLVIAVGVMLATLGCVEKPEQKEEMVLSNYPKLFEKDVIIVVGENASIIEMEGAQAIAEILGNLTGNAPLIKKDVEITENEKAGYNLVLVGTPDANSLLRDVYERTNATRVTYEYPGAGKGVLEILRSPWNEENAILLVAGSDEWGVRAGDLILKENKQLKNKAKLFVNWEEYTGVVFPIDSSEEAIRYAETDSDVNEFIREWSAGGFKIGTWAEWDPVYNVWEVGVSPGNNIRDILFLLHIKPNGTIIEKGIVPTT
jgi:hypothetical protein